MTCKWELFNKNVHQNWDFKTLYHPLNHSICDTYSDPFHKKLGVIDERPQQQKFLFSFTFHEFIIDGQTYPSRCHLIRAQCNGYEVTFKHRGRCKGN